MEFMSECEIFYKRGKYKDCLRQLQHLIEKERHSLSVKEIIVLMNNKLSCQLQQPSITIKELDKIKQEYWLLWQLISGLPWSHDSEVTIIIICNIISCLVRIWIKTNHIPLINQGMSLIKEWTENTCVNNCNEEESPYRERLKVLKCLLISIIDKSDCCELLQQKDNLFQIENSPDTCYKKAYQLYINGQYSECISTLHCIKRQGQFIKNCGQLLLANCHAQSGRLQAALYYYHQCLSSSLSSLLINDTAIHNVCCIYQSMSGAEMNELKMREFHIELLKSKSSEVVCPLPRDSFLWQQSDSSYGCVVKCSDWRLVTYELIKRTFKLEKYSIAIISINTLLHDITNNQLLPPDVPSITLLIFLSCHAHLLSEDIEQASQVLETISNREIRNQYDSTEVFKLWYRSLILRARGDLGGANHMTTMCLGIINELLINKSLINNFEDTVYSIEHLDILKELLINNSAVYAIKDGRLSHAHSLLVSLLSMGNCSLNILYNYCLLCIKTGHSEKGLQYWMKEKDNYNNNNTINSYHTLLLTQYASN